MSQPPYLTDAEIADLTEPLTQGAARIKYIAALGMMVRAKPNGQPLVGRAEFEAVMLGRAHVEHAVNDDMLGSRPNFDALKNRVRYASGQKT